MFRLLVIVSLLGMLCPLLGHSAETTEESYSYYLLSCGSYVAHRSAPKPEITAADSYYIGGWISAFNKLSPRSDTFKNDLDLESIMLWLEGYCKANPLSDISGGLIQLAHEQHNNTAPIESVEKTDKVKTRPAIIVPEKQNTLPTFPEVTQ